MGRCGGMDETRRQGVLQRGGAELALTLIFFNYNTWLLALEKYPLIP